MTASVPHLLGGRYEVGELLGRGGMAEVHYGYDTRLGRPVAIKILSEDFARKPRIVQRFLQEARASSALRSCPRHDLLVPIPPRSSIGRRA